MVNVVMIIHCGKKGNWAMVKHTQAAYFNCCTVYHYTICVQSTDKFMNICQNK